MNIPLTVKQNELLDVLLNVAIVRPVFIWGAVNNRHKTFWFAVTGRRGRKGKKKSCS